MDLKGKTIPQNSRDERQQQNRIAKETMVENLETFMRYKMMRSRKQHNLICYGNSKASYT
jgi:hypothetical protein